MREATKDSMLLYNLSMQKMPVLVAYPYPLDLKIYTLDYSHR